jgi:hypothetical protein
MGFQLAPHAIIDALDIGEVEEVAVTVKLDLSL